MKIHKINFAQLFTNKTKRGTEIPQKLVPHNDENHVNDIG